MSKDGGGGTNPPIDGGRGGGGGGGIEPPIEGGSGGGGGGGGTFPDGGCGDAGIVISPKISEYCLLNPVAVSASTFFLK